MYSSEHLLFCYKITCLIRHHICIIMGNSIFVGIENDILNNKFSIFNGRMVFVEFRILVTFQFFTNSLGSLVISL